MPRLDREEAATILSPPLGGHGFASGFER
jgi:hypothetical protein